MTLLVTSAGRRTQLIGCFRESAEHLGIDLKVLAADSRPDTSAACRLADARFAVPHCHQAEYIPFLLELCRQHGVQLLVPTIDPELAVLSRHRDDFAKVGTRVVISGPKAVSICQAKQATADHLAAAGVTVPRTLPLAEYLDKTDALRWPVIAKPNTGSASIGIVRPQSLSNLHTLDPHSYIVQELWEGREYTVNVYFDRAGTLRCAVPHERLEVRAGEVSKGVTRRMPVLEAAAQKLTQALTDPCGPLCFQAIVAPSGEAAVFEINSRFGGGYPLAHHAGARMSQWLIEELYDLPLSAHNDWQAGVTMLRYDAAVFFNE